LTIKFLHQYTINNIHCVPKIHICPRSRHYESRSATKHQDAGHTSCTLLLVK